jgi:hypothetical protein
MSSPKPENPWPRLENIRNQTPISRKPKQYRVLLENPTPIQLTSFGRVDYTDLSKNLPTYIITTKMLESLKKYIQIKKVASKGTPNPTPRTAAAAAAGGRRS